VIVLASCLLLKKLRERRKEENMPRGEAGDEQACVAHQRKSPASKDVEQNSEARRGKRSGLITAMLRHYMICSELTRGSVPKEGSR
jgi:hypothetical protein